MAQPSAAQRNISAVPICAHSDDDSGCGSIRRAQVRLAGRRTNAAITSFTLDNRSVLRAHLLRMRNHLSYLRWRASVNAPYHCRITHFSNLLPSIWCITRKIRPRIPTATTCKVHRTRQTIPATSQHLRRMDATEFHDYRRIPKSIPQHQNHRLAPP